MDTEATADSEAMRRTARRLAWVGIEVGRPGRRFAFDREDIAAGSGGGDTVDLADVMKPLEDMSSAMVDYFKKIEKWAKIINLGIDVVVGAIVAGIAMSVQNDQFAAIVCALIAIQTVLAVVGFGLFWRGLEDSIKLAVDGITQTSSVKYVQTWKYRREKLSLFGKMVLLSYPIRIFELFLFVCGSLVVFTYSADAASLTPMERFAHWGFNLISNVFYGNDNLTPQQRAGAAALNFAATTVGGVVLEFVFPTKLKAESDTASKLMIGSWPAVAAALTAVGVVVNGSAPPVPVTPALSPAVAAPAARVAGPPIIEDLQSASDSSDMSVQSSSSETSSSETSIDSSSPAPMEALAPPRYIGGDWTYPGSDEMGDLYPPRAQDNEIEGTVTIDCAVNATGRVTGCDILSESPAGYGFGLATVKAFIHYAHVDPASVDGGLRDGDRKKFTYKWTLGDSSSS